MDAFEFRHRITNRPRRKEPGEAAFYIPREWVSSSNELALSMFLITNRPLFGLAYAGLQPDYFAKMPKDSGVYIAVGVETKHLNGEITRPGDIDLLIVPYENDELILHRMVAVELKVVRASFLNQGKSPNEFGFTQAAGLRAAGIPYVAVAHLIVSDLSPRDAWREMGLARVLDKEGRAEMLDPIQTDCLPIDLMARSFGRLEKASCDSGVGLVAAYLDLPGTLRSSQPGYWFPDTKRAEFNPHTRRSTLDRAASFFEARFNWFLDNPRW